MDYLFRLGSHLDFGIVGKDRASSIAGEGRWPTLPLSLTEEEEEEREEENVAALTLREIFSAAVGEDTIILFLILMLKL